eukprot:CAMPEP_0118971358 /NCGR_PEP_ID=MMETSP1173-20130426/8007_1 /TAXON_ID=1034831 /ORGANISM="Rhizochromulina marina cf, Strain CCMP1243" /LENGTH=512 /DNA_ID=CAMNT_0006920803 /DNA_START=121 /DNA_END=1655 /DNA_ORIENTATION=+
MAGDPPAPPALLVAAAPLTAPVPGGETLVCALFATVGAWALRSVFAKTACVIAALAILCLLWGVYLKRRRAMMLYFEAHLKRSYGLSANGFLPSRPVPLLRGDLCVWEDISRDLPQLLRSNSLRQTIHAMPTLSLGDGAPAPLLRRAYVLLGQLVHAYVHMDACPTERIPAEASPLGTEAALREDAATDDAGRPVVPPQLAVPFLAASRALGMEPVLTAAATDLWNFHFISEDKGFALENLTCRSTLTGTDAERFFHMIPCAMQAAAGPVLPQVLRAPYHVLSGDVSALTRTLHAMARLFREFQAIFKRTAELVDRDMFYDVYRPLLNGFHPKGVALQLTTEGEPLVVTPKGPSAGQSAMFVVFDTVLGVSHPPSGVMGGFQEEMVKGYMPEPHRCLVRDLSAAVTATSSLDSYVAQQSRGQAHLCSAFLEAVDALTAFRRQHLATVTGFLSTTSTGTGASHFQVLLREAIENTARVGEMCRRECEQPARANKGRQHGHATGGGGGGGRSRA